jgi:hypothetical protein
MVSTVSLTLESGKNIVRKDHIEEHLHKTKIHISAHEPKQAQEENSIGTTLQSHQAINEKNQLENGTSGKNVGASADTTGGDNGKLADKVSGDEKVHIGDRGSPKIINGIPYPEAGGKPKQDMLLLYGPGQRYRLEKEQNIPELQNDREILIQVNPEPACDLLCCLNPCRRFSPLG